MKKLILLLVLVVCVYQSVTAAVDPLNWIWKVTQTYQIHGVQFSPDDKYILIWNFDNTAIVDAATGTTLFTKYSMAYPVWMKDGKHFIALSRNPIGQFFVIVETGTWIAIDSFPAEGDAFSLSPDERTIAVASRTIGELAFYDLVKKQRTKKVEYFHTKDYPKQDMYPTIVQMLWSQDNKYLIYTAADGRLRFWDVEKDSIVFTYFSGYGILRKNSEGSKIAFKTGKQDYAVQVMDVASRQIVEEVIGTSNKVSGIAFSPDSRFIAIAFGNNSSTLLNIYTINNFELKAQAKYSSFGDCTFSHNNKYLSSCVADILYLYDVRQIVSVGEENENTVHEILYPNPVTEIIRLKPVPTFIDKVNIDIVNSIGSIVKSLEQNSFEEMFINVQDIPSGSYTLIISDGKKECKIRFTKL